MSGITPVQPPPNGGYYNQVSQGVQNLATSQAVTTVSSLPSDTLQIGAVSLSTVINISKQIVTARKGEMPNEEIKFHSGAGVFKTGRNAAIVGGLISTGQNLYQFVNGKVTGAQATGNVTADVVGALGSGIAAAGVGTLATSMIASTAGAGILGLVVGAATFAGTEFLYRNSGVYTSVSTGVSNFVQNVLNRIKPGGGW